MLLTPVLFKIVHLFTRFMKLNKYIVHIIQEKKVKGRDHIGDLSFHMMIILKWILVKCFDDVK